MSSLLETLSAFLLSVKQCLNPVNAFSSQVLKKITWILTNLSAWQLKMRCYVVQHTSPAIVHSMYTANGQLSQSQGIIWAEHTECWPAMSRHEKYDRETNRQTNKWSISISSLTMHSRPSHTARETHSKMASSQKRCVNVLYTMYECIYLLL